MDVPLASPVMTEEMKSEVDRVLSEEFFLRGKTVAAFEDDYAEFVGTDHAIAVSSGTEALHLSLRALDVGSGDTVITTPATFISTANSIVRTGADVRFVDVDLDTYTIDIEAVERAVEEEDDVAAVIPIHLYGYPIDIDRLRQAVGDVPIVSDACQAHGASRDGVKTGAMSDLGTFSFYPSKNMTVGGDGGMVTTDDEELATLVRSFSDVGRSMSGGSYEHVRIGYTARMDTMKAAIGRKQLQSLPGWNERRTEIAAKYTEKLGGIRDIVLPPTGDKTVEPAWYFYVVRVRERDEFMRFLGDRGIETGVHYPTPIHLQPPYRELGYHETACPDSERWANEVVSLPVHPQLTDEQVDHVIESVHAFFE